MISRVPVRAVAAALVLLALAVGLASCGEREEDTPQIATVAPPTEPGSAPASPAPPPTDVNTPTPPLPTPSPTDGWTYYSHPARPGAPAFGFSYPSDWFISAWEPPEEVLGMGVLLTTWDTTTAPGHDGIPDESQKIDISVTPLADGAECQSEGQPVTILAGLPAIRVVGTAEAEGLTRTIWVAARSTNTCFILSGLFSQAAPGEDLYDGVVESFELW